MMNSRDYFINRRTIKKYTSQVITPSMLRDIIEQASHAPTTGNMQLYSVIVTRSEEMKHKLAPAHFNQPQVTGASVVLTVCADFNRFVKWCIQRGASPGFDNLQSFVTACLDAVIFAQQICTVAEMNGLGCCYIGTTTYNPKEIAEALHLPKRVIPLITLTLGYPADEGVEVGRLPVEAVMHDEYYHDYSAEDIDRHYEEKEVRDDSRRFVRENKVPSLADVFTNFRYTREGNEAFSYTLARHILANYPFEPEDAYKDLL